MGLDPRTPVLVGAGVATQHFEEPAEALEPSTLMTEAVRAAGEDAGCPPILALASSIRVPRGFWAYRDPGRLVAEEIGAAGAHTILFEIGILQQTLISDACRAIAEGEEEVAIVCGSDTKYRSLRAQITQTEVREVAQSEDVSPDETRLAKEPLWHELEWQRGLMMPVHFFSVMENALRFARGLSIAEHRDEIARVWAGCSEVAARNPHAWGPAPVAWQAIRDASEGNRMIAFPYTRLHNSNWNVDQAAGLVLCSIELARQLGIARERWIFPRSATESNCVVPLAARPDLHRSRGAAIAGARALELAGREIEAVDHLDLYSCFPAAMRIFAAELGLDPDRPHTVTGGMAFAGGPLNNYVLQATARMAEVLREDPGSTGLVSCVSGLLNKQGFGVWSSEPRSGGFAFADCTREAARASDRRAITSDYRGRATLAGYTVIYLGDAPAKAVAICDLPDGRRTVANSDDRDLAAALTESEYCGCEVEIAGDGVLTRL